MDYSKLDQYLENNLDQSLEELGDFCKIPTISAQKLNLEEGAEYAGEMLKKRGFSVEIHPTNGAPIVFAERKGRSSEKTLLFYNHYDVQPPEPLDLWESPPFEPSIREGKIFAR
nr:M20/M25/M40 family metallo-hydrolase [Candidatus Saccharibacteria bacterium]